MADVFNGPNGKVALVVFGFLGFGVLVLCGYGMYLGYSPYMSCGIGKLALSKVNA